MFIAPSEITVLVAAFDARPRSKVPASLVCDGEADDKTLVEALSRLVKGGGGHVHLTEGTYKLSKTVVAEVDDVLISGRGRSTHLVYDGVRPCISSGIRTGWMVRNLRTDPGGVYVVEANECVAEYWRDGSSFVIEGAHIRSAGGETSLGELVDTAIRSGAAIGKQVKSLQVTKAGKLEVFYEDGS